MRPSQGRDGGSIPLTRSNRFAIIRSCLFSSVYAILTANMKLVLTTLLILGLLGIAVFGVFAMNHGSGYGHNGCIAATLQGADCPKGENALSFLTFHLGAFQSFSTAIFGQTILSLFLLVASLLLLARIVLSTLYITPEPSDLHSRFRHFLELPASSFQKRIIRWLALHENSPAFL